MISKDQLGNNCVNKWEDYGLIIEKNVFEKIKQFEPINSNANKNNKGFRTSKNGRDTGIFKKLEEYQRNNIMGNNNNNNIQGDINQQDNERIPQNVIQNKINIIPANKINEDDD